MFQCRSGCRQGVENARKMALDRLLQKDADTVMNMGVDTDDK